MTPLCGRTLAEALDPGAIRLWTGALLPVVAMVGVGSAIAPGLTALPVGLGLSTLVLMLLHGLGLSTVVIYPLWSSLCLVIAAMGMGRSQKWTLSHGRLTRSEWIVLGVTLPLAMHLVNGPMPFGDLVAIWTLHAKALVCDPIFQAPYTREAVWAGTHPEYPLLMPLIHAWTFWASDSFRDDAVRLWQSALLLVSTLAAWRGVLRATKSRWLAGAAVGMTLALQGLQVFDGRVEGVAMLLGGWTVLLAWEGDWRALPWVLFALAMTKNESWVASVLLLVALTWASDRSKREVRRGLFTSAVLLAVWLPFARGLPNLHEQYAARVLSPSAWREGWPGLPSIVAHTGLRLLTGPWGAILVGAILLLWLRRGGSEGPKGKTRGLVPHVAWALGLSLLAMGAVFMAIYTVSPWGPGLYANTWDRLVVAQALRGGWLLLLLLPYVRSRWPRWVHGISVALCLGYGLAAVERSVGAGWEDLRHAYKGQVGLAAYRAAAPWARALALDAKLPPRALSVQLDDRLYELNYMLSPRRFYPALPDVIAATQRPWREFRTGDSLPVDEFCALGVRWIVRGSDVSPLGRCNR